MDYLKVYIKTEQLLYLIYPRLRNYPKAEKFCLCQEIKQNFYDLLKFISLGTAVKSKRITYLQEADGHLQVIKTLMKLSCEQKYIGKNFYRHIDLELTEINKMLAGYIRSSAKR